MRVSRILRLGRPRGCEAGRRRQWFSRSPYLIELNARSNEFMYALPTAFTFFEWIRFVSSQMNGTAGAWAVIILSISPHAW